MAKRSIGTREGIALADYSEKSREQSENINHEDKQNGTNGGDSFSLKSELGCGVKQLPERLLFRAAELAARINPVNAPSFGRMEAVGGQIPNTPMFAAVVTSKYWGPTPRRLTVSFMGSVPSDVRSRIVSNLNAWSRTGCIEFVETQEIGQVRISLGGGGYWSYLGTDILLIPRNRPTMNLQGFSMNTPESEYTRVVRHEAGHTLGMPHEHMRRALVSRIDPEKAYEYFRRTQGWDRATVDQQVLTPLEEASLLATPADQDSIMCYRLPGSITRDGQPIRGGADINDSDYAFVGKVYPKQSADLSSATYFADDWSENEDVDVESVIVESSY